MRRKIILCSLFVVITSPLVAMRLWPHPGAPAAAIVPTTGSATVLSSLADPQPTTAPAVRVTLTMDTTQFAGRPVVMTVNVTNIGAAPFSYWCGGPDRYPQAEDFQVEVSGSDGKSIDVGPTNGQYTEGSGIGRAIASGKSIKTPLAIAPLAAGAWSVQVATVGELPDSPKTPPIKVTIKDDPAAAAKWDRQLLDRVRDRQPFARDLSSTYRNIYVVEVKVHEISSKDKDVAEAAAEFLMWEYRSPLPSDAEKPIEAAISNWLQSRDSTDFIENLPGLAAAFPTDAMLDSVLRVLHSQDGSTGLFGSLSGVRYRAAQVLGNFPQKRATTELTALLKDNDASVRKAAKASLEEQQTSSAATKPATAAAMAHQ